MLNKLKAKFQYPNLNWYQQLFSGIQLPGSNGKKSMHVTVLWYVGVLPVIATVVAEIWRVARRPEAEFATGFWALASTLVTVVIAANGVKEYQIRKQRLETGSTGADTGSTDRSEPGEPAEVVETVPKKRYGKYAKKAPTTTTMPTRPLVLPSKKGESDNHL